MTDWQMVGSWADWTTAATALLAFIVATIAAVATWRTNSAQQKTLDLQRQQFEATQEHIERAQASKISYYVERPDMRATETRDSKGELTNLVIDGEGSRRVQLMNASETPIQLIVIAQTLPTKRVLYEADYLFPTGARPEIWVLDEPTDWPVAITVMFFTDAAGISWARTTDGSLRKSPGEWAEYSVMNKYEQHTTLLSDDDSK